MNHYIAHSLGALARWILNGFTTSYMDEFEGRKGFKTNKEQIRFETKTIALGYLTALIISVIAGLIIQNLKY